MLAVAAVVCVFAACMVGACSPVVVNVDNGSGGAAGSDAPQAHEGASGQGPSSESTAATAAATGAAGASAASADASSAAAGDRNVTASAPAPSSSASAGSAVASPPVAYPCGWLIADSGGIAAGRPLNILRMAGFDAAPHRSGRQISASEQAELAREWPAPDDSQALVQQDGTVALVPVDLLFVNLPDVLPDAVFDIVYAHASTSSCAGEAIPGVTGERIPGYAPAPRENAYLGTSQFVAPCAYRTALKARDAASALAQQGYRLLVYDAYRPMTAQRHLSDCFQTAFWNSPGMQASLGAWSLDWYVAPGASGHNFGTDLDVGVCDAQGNPVSMPSAFDAFDDTGHLTAQPLAASSITPDAYCAAVAGNPACLALHQAFTAAGFSELASEWWHFGDDQTMAIVSGIVGPAALDFVA
ncbi:MAG TPA: hypothetical protein DCP91_07750 [Eggerthellaceae bacterium]|nr:hypothetical protein [Eggerthellaceae bacterium]